jgi:hypothetical protein
MSTLRFNDRLHLSSNGDGRAVLARLFATLATYWSALKAGHAASRAYHQLRARGTPHDIAVRQIFNDHFKGR